MDFEWNDKKAASNLKKHGVRFTEAASIWLDPNSIEIHDEDHSKDDDDRWVRLGFSKKLRILVVVFAEKAEAETIRIISARKADKMEQQTYTERLKL